MPATLAAALSDTTITFARDCTGANAITLTTTLYPLANLTLDAITPAHTVTIHTGSDAGRRLFRVNGGITLTLRGLTLSGDPQHSGGAIASSGAVRLTRCNLVDNYAGEGGAITSTGTLVIVNSTFANNSAGVRGGGILSYGTLAIIGSTFSGNSATYGGGAIHSAKGVLRLAHSIIANDRAGLGLFGVVTDEGGNVIENATGSTGLTARSDRLNITAQLAPLSDNGGTVQTFALMSGSPAIGIAACPTDPITMLPLATDARGVSRPQDAKCDAGSYQTVASP